MNRIRLTREDRKNQTKKRLLAAAQKLVPKKGLTATSVDDIVALAGYTRGALYANFRGKHELFFEVLRRDQEQLTDQFHAMLSNAEPIESFLVRTRNVYQIYCGGDDHFKNWTEARMLGSRDETFRAKLNPLLAERRDLVEQFVEYVYQNTGAHPAAPSFMALGVMSLLEGIKLLEVSSPSEMTVPAAESILVMFMASVLHIPCH